ncbi:DUF4270 family protein [Aquirufa rosea]|nr:DUF4270 family protein [Aquirufa rosea]
MISISSKNCIWNWPAIKWVGILSLFLSSCDLPKEIGSDLFSVEVGLNYTDSLSIQSSTVLIDSIYTNQTNTFQIGSYQNPILGTVSASAFTQIANVDTLKSKETSILDSLKMQLVYASYVGDTTKMQTISVYRLKDSVSRFVDYFNHSSVGYDPTPIGTHSFYPRPVKAKTANGDSLKFDTLRFKMNPAFGRELLSKYTDKTIAAGGPGFREFFKGMHFRTTSDARAALIGINPIYSVMTLHYHNPNDTLKYAVNYYFSLSTALVSEVHGRFNQINITRAGALANLKKPGDRVPATQTNMLTYVQSGTGLATKIEIPYLLNLKGKGNVAINKAELVIPAADSYELDKVLGSLSLVETDASNRTLRNSYGLRYLLTEGGTGAQTSTFNFSNKTYSFNITTAIQNIISNNRKNFAILVTSPLTTNSSGFSRIIGENVRYVPLDASKIKLKVYYTYVAK